MPYQGLVAVLNDVWDAVTHALRVEPAAGSFPVSGTVTANQGAAGAASWPVTQPDITVTGTLTNNGDTVTIALNGAGTAYLETNNTLAAGAQLEATVDGVNWRSYAGIVRNTGGPSDGQFFASLVGTTAANTWRFQCSGLVGLRIRALGAMAPPVSCTWRAAAGGCGVVSLDNTVNQTSTATQNLDGVSTTTTYFSTMTGTIISQRAIPSLFTGAGVDKQRTPAMFKTAQATAAGSTALWTPAAGKKFRLMRYRVTVTGNAAQAAGGVLTVSLLDAAGATNLVDDVFVPGAALSTAGSLYDSDWVDLGNGLLSAVANNVLNINLSAALTAGNVRVIACGTEE